MSKEEKEKERQAEEAAQLRYEALKKTHNRQPGLASIFKSASDVTALALCGYLFIQPESSLLAAAPWVPLAALGLGVWSLASVFKGCGKIWDARKNDTPAIKTLTEDFSTAARRFGVQQIYSMMAMGFSYLILDTHVHRIMTQSPGPNGLPPAAIASAIAVAFGVYACANAKRRRVYEAGIDAARKALPPPVVEPEAKPEEKPEAKTETKAEPVTPPVVSAPPEVKPA